jgi:hypothetical protein
MGDMTQIKRTIEATCSGMRSKEPLDDIEFVFFMEEGYDKEALEKKPFKEPESSYLTKMANKILVPGVYTSWGTYIESRPHLCIYAILTSALQIRIRLLSIT